MTHPNVIHKRTATGGHAGRRYRAFLRLPLLALWLLLQGGMRISADAPPGSVQAAASAPPSSVQTPSEAPSGETSGAAPQTDKTVQPAAKTNPVVESALEVLREECVSCHRPGKAKGGLKLVSAEDLKAGGESGPAIAAGKAQDSLLHAVLLKEGDPHMPPKKQLTPAQTDAIKAWINAGAEWDAAVMEKPPKAKPVTLRPMPKGVQPVLAVVFSPDGSSLAVARGGRVEIRDAKQERYPVKRTFDVHPESIQALVWSPDGNAVYTGGFRRVGLWRVADGVSQGEWTEGLVGQITALALSAKGEALWVGDSLPSRGGFIHRLDWSRRQEVKTWKAHDDSVYGLALSADGRWLASAGADRVARRWDADTSALVATYEGHTNQVLGVAFDSATPRLATTGADREIKVWDRDSREQDAVLGDKKQVVTSLFWSKDGSRLVGVTDRGNGAVYSAIQKHTGEQRSDTSKVQKLDKVEPVLQCVCTTADGALVAAGAADGRVFIWKAADGKLQPAD